MLRDATALASVSSSFVRRSASWVTASTSLPLPTVGPAFPFSSHATRRASEGEPTSGIERKRRAIGRWDVLQFARGVLIALFFSHRPLHAGLKAGDKVVLNPDNRIASGVKVEVYDFAVRLSE